jgi:hypothetical protein
MFQKSPRGPIFVLF